MRQLKQETVIRIILTLVILLAGVTLIPFIERPLTAIGWELFAGVYSPILDVNETTGAPGSVFAFTGSNFPPNSLAAIYINGNPTGTVMTDAVGAASFLLNTTGAAPDQYNVTMEVDINASVTRGIELVAGGTTVTPPPDAAGDTVFITHIIFLPSIQKN